MEIDPNSERMTFEKQAPRDAILGVAEKYRRLLVRRSYPELSPSAVIDDADSGMFTKMRSCHSLLRQVIDNAATNNPESALATLRFVQGALWSNSLLTFDEAENDVASIQLAIAIASPS